MCYTKPTLQQTNTGPQARALLSAAGNDARTVIASIHSPSWALVSAGFDTILLLGFGGQVLFIGAPTSMASYFITAGAKPPTSHENPADYAIHIIFHEGTEKWAAKWEEDTTYRDTDEQKNDTELVVHHRTVSIWEQYKVLTWRAVRIFFADLSKAFSIYTMAILGSLFVALVVVRGPYNVSKMNVLQFHTLSSFQALANPLVVMMPFERLILAREVSNGTYGIGIYWCSQVTLALINGGLLAILSAIVISPCIVNSGLSMHVTAPWYATMALHYSSCFVAGMTLGMFAPNAFVGMKIAPASMQFMILACGFSVPQHRARPLFRPFKYPNLFSWSTRALAILTFSSGSGSSSARHVLTEMYNIDPGNLLGDLMALILTLLTLCVLGFIVTHVKINGVFLGGLSSSNVEQSRAPTDATRAEYETEVNSNDKPIEVNNPEDEAESDVEIGELSRNCENEISVPRNARYHITASCTIRSFEFYWRSPYRGTRVDPVLQDLNLHLKASTITIIVGPSGAGKSLEQCQYRIVAHLYRTLAGWM